MKIYGELPYEDIIQAVKKAFIRQEAADFVSKAAANLKRKYSTREIADTDATSELNASKAMRYAAYAKSQKTNDNQDAGTSQRGREGAEQPEPEAGPSRERRSSRRRR